MSVKQGRAIRHTDIRVTIHGQVQAVSPLLLPRRCDARCTSLYPPSPKIRKNKESSHATEFDSKSWPGGPRRLIRRKKMRCIYIHTCIPITLKGGNEGREKLGVGTPTCAQGSNKETNDAVHPTTKVSNTRPAPR